MALTRRASGLLREAANWLLYHDAVRRPVVRAVDWWLGIRFRPSHDHHAARGAITRQRRLVYRAIVHTMDRVLGERLLSPHVARVITGLWGETLLSWGRQPAVQRFRQEHGCDPPWFLVISPGYACNLRCPGCYADSGPGQGILGWSVIDRVVTEAKALWGVRLFVLSGGEPLLYRSEGKGILDLVEKHSDCLFLMFTNGTLMSADVVTRLSRLGNLTPALSVEGMREQTDGRRGVGVFDRILVAMADLRKAGVPFGISATVTRSNCEEILSDKVLDYFFGDQGAFYGFLFQYTPIGRGAEFDLVPSPEQRTQLWRRSWEVVAEKRLFLLDFGNHGPLVEGCIAAGRERGYLYIDWNGKVMPCVFAPYSAANINQVYANDGTLNDVWETPFFEAVRQWQRDYGYGHEALSPAGNWMHPCPFRDHHELFQQWIERYELEPEDEAARAAVTNREYGKAMIACGMRNLESSQEIWDKDYLGRGEKLDAGS
ncbi:MAG TPA: radical SAM protein [Anaerolineae bacterium]|nr:radical SAM protein [Anaerolineae bacterium]